MFLHARFRHQTLKRLCHTIRFAEEFVNFQCQNTQTGSWPRQAPAHEPIAATSCHQPPGRQSCRESGAATPDLNAFLPRPSRHWAANGKPIVAIFLEDPISFFAMSASRSLWTGISGTVGASHNGATSCQKNGKRRFRPHEIGTGATTRSCGGSAGSLSESGSISLNEIRPDASQGSSRHGPGAPISSTRANEAWTDRCTTIYSESFGSAS